MSDLKLKVPEEFRRGAKKDREQESVESGLGLLALMCSKLGIANLANKRMLDMGCGNKFVQAILESKHPIGHYVGIDIHAGLIAFLQENVTDNRFTFHTSDTRNDMYNPDGEPLSEQSRLPVDEASFDIICLFSVFTHLAPDDYVLMLKLLRRYIKPDGRIFFTLIINETTEGGHGFLDMMAPYYTKALSKKDIDIGLQGRRDFVDWVPEKPLWRAVYSRENAIRLVAGTGWEIESLNDPEPQTQHYMICKPV